MKNEHEKPPVGVKPYYIAIPNRIIELSDAISSYADELDNDASKRVELYASEITALCRLYEWMRERDKQI